MAELVLAEQLLQYLVDQSVVRKGSTAGALPPAWLDPIDGAKQPSGADTSAVTIRRTGHAPTGHLEGFLEQQVIEIIVRSTTSPVGELLQRSIRGKLHDKHNLTMGSLKVEWCLQWRGVQPLPPPPGAKTKTWDTTQSFLFQVRVASLTV